MIKLPAYLNGFSSKADGSASLRFSTQELQADDFAQFQKAQNAFGWLLFSENDIDIQDVPKELIEDKNKTPAKRLRNTLFVLHQQTNTNQDFEVYYREKMEKMIEMIKSKLD